MAYHDLECKKCKVSLPYAHIRLLDKPHVKCGGKLEIVFVNPRQRFVHAVPPKERSVVWKHPVTGQIRYPGRNDVPMPERYASIGYERHEMVHASDLHKFERDNNVCNEKLNYDSNGRQYEDECEFGDKPLA